MPEEVKPKRRKKILFVIGGCLVLCLAALVVLVLLARASANKQEKQTEGPVPQPAVPITAETLEQVRELYFIPQEGYIHDVAWSPDGRMLAVGMAKVGSSPGSIQLWDAVSGGSLHIFEQISVDRLVFSPDGKMLAAGGDEGVTVWNLADMSQLSHTPLNNPMIVYVAFSPDSRILAYEMERSVVLVDMPGGKELRTFQIAGDLRYFAFLPDEKSLTTAIITLNSTDGNTKFSVWDIESGREIETFRQPGGIDEFAVSPDGKTFVGTFSVTTLRVWERESGEVLQSFEGFRFGTTRFALSPEGSVLAAGEGRGFEVASPSGLRLFDLVNGQEAPILRAHKGVIKSLAFSPDGRFLATGSEDHSVRIWGVAPGEVGQTTVP